MTRNPAPQFDEVGIAKASRGGVEMTFEELQKDVIADVSGSHNQQLLRRTVQEVRIAKVTILGDHHPVWRIRCVDDLGVSGRVAVRDGWYGQRRGLRR